MAEQYDAVVIGGGHNGLTCGAYLARAGLKTLVLERRTVIGGAAVSEQVVPGFTFSVFSYLMSLLHPKVISELELKRFGLTILPASDMFGPLPGGDAIIFSDSVEKTQKSFARFSEKDAAIYPAFDAYINECARIIRQLLLETPPDPSCRDWKSFKDYAPGFSDGVIGMQVLTPPDIEAKLGSPHGHIFHGELQLDQLFFARPAPHAADYRSPIKGLYQCGSSAHPGGGGGAVPGHNAAREILKDWR